MELEYGKWCTVGGNRYMIVDWTRWNVIVHTLEGRMKFDKSVVTEVSDFRQTDAERKALGYVF